MLQEGTRAVVVLSGKGGVGKSSVATGIAVSLAEEGNKVGILDLDLCGPSIARILGVEGKEVMQSSEGWLPVQAGENNPLAVMSVSFLLASRDNAVVWRGPKKNAMIKQFFTDVVWGKLDYLIIDTPPGTSDEQLSCIEYLKETNFLSGAVLVTTPQSVSIVDVRKEISFCKKLEVPILGMVENMSGFQCPCCGEVTDIFSRGGGEKLAIETGMKFLGRIPIELKWSEMEDTGKMSIQGEERKAVMQPFKQVIQGITSA